MSRDSSPTSSPTLTLANLAERFDLELRGDGAHRVQSVGTLESAGPEAVTFLANRAYRPRLAETRAGAVILRSEDAEECPVNALLAADPYLAYARVARLFDPRPRPAPGIDPLASVHPDALLGDGVAVCAGAVVAREARIGDGAIIGPGCVIAPGVEVGPDCHLVANVTLGDGVRLGRRVLVHPGAVIGADGFGIARGPDGWEKVPQLGGVLVGDDCEIGANSCIDRGAIGDTVLEEDVRLDNHVQIGHNCHVGAHTAMAAYTGISGSTRIGRNCLFAGRSGAYGHLSIADGVTVGAMTMVSKDVTEPGTTWSGGIPARPLREWQRTLAQLNRLGKTLRAVRAASPKQGNQDD